MNARDGSFLSRTLRRLLSVRSARGVSLALSFLPLASKPLGYLRTLLTAWAFGTSPGMDSFHLANSIISLFAGSVGGALQSSVLPEIVRARHETGDDRSSRSIVALTTWVVMALTALFCAAVAIAPGVMVRFFASGFDPERVRIGAIMLWWLAPFAIVTMCKPVADIWALFTERYTLSAICSLPFNFIAIPSMLLAIPLIGVYSVAFSMSVSHAILFALFLCAMRGVPTFQAPGRIPAKSIIRIGKNSTCVAALIAANTVFMVIDRYFASRLPSGSVAAISYGGVLIGIISALSESPMTFLLKKLSGAAAENRGESIRMTESTLAIVLAYFMPVSLFASAAARPIVSLLYGWGNFGVSSVDMTATAISAYCYGIMFSVATTVLYRYAQAAQKLAPIVAFSGLTIAANAILDWFMVQRWGIWGLALATSITQIIGFVLYYSAVIGRGLPAFLIRSRFFLQLAVTTAYAAVSFWSGVFGTAVHAVSALVIAVLYIFTAERLNLMPCVPEHWRPMKLASFILGSARSYFSA
ncbi:MAG: hypothetical protein LBQ56_01590 [Synergistaceae bacterium]|jgi:putative peptidoglycan lipid II flippase|nr:hypothetical protein [Synergistaceae bacterium]